MIERVGSHSYLVKLLEYLRAVPYVFYVFLLEPAPQQYPKLQQFALFPIKLDGNLEFEVV